MDRTSSARVPPKSRRTCCFIAFPPSFSVENCPSRFQPILGRGCEAVDALFPVLHAAAEAVRVPCDCDADHGALRMALTAQGLFGAGMTDRAHTPVRAVDIVFRFLASKGAHP